VSIVCEILRRCREVRKKREIGFSRGLYPAVQLRPGTKSNDFATSIKG